MSEHSKSAEARMLYWGQQQMAERAFRKVAQVFRDAELPVVPIKGLALARWLYKDVGDRGLRDVDLLVPPERFREARDAVRRAGWSIVYDVTALRELLFYVDGVAVEVHGEIARRDLTGLATRDVIQRAAVDHATFGFEVLRIDDLDHFILLAGNVIKDRFVECNPQIRTDLRLLWERVGPRSDELVSRTRVAGFGSGLRAVAEWMAVHGAREFDLLERKALGRSGQVRALRVLHEREIGRPLGLVVACASNDHPLIRGRCLLQLAGSGLRRLLPR